MLWTCFWSGVMPMCMGLHPERGLTLSHDCTKILLTESSECHSMYLSAASTVISVSQKVRHQRRRHTWFKLKDAVHDLVSRKQWLIGWDCLWLGPNHYVCFPFTEPGLCRNGRVCFSANTERTARGPWGAIHWIWQKVYGITIVDCTFKRLQTFFEIT